MRWPTKAEWIGTGNWLRKDFAEWFIGSWAKIITWFIVGVIFLSFLQMDGYFSRGLGEGSGVDPDLFMHIGWMFRFFAAVFLTLSVKFMAMGMKDESVKLKWLGAFCTIVIVAHAMGFGLKALEGKRANAVAIVEVAQAATDSNSGVIAALEKQKIGIEQNRDKQLANLQVSIDNITKDNLDNDDLADAYRKDQAEERRLAREAIAALDVRIVDLTVVSGNASTAATKDIITTEKWAPLFVGLAQLFTWNQNPSDWAIYLSGVIFLMSWILLGDSIVILVPPALYKMHLRDAQRERFAKMGQKGGKTTARRSRVREKQLAIEDYTNQKAAETRADLDADVEEEDFSEDETPAQPERDVDLTSEDVDGDQTGNAKAA